MNEQPYLRGVCARRQGGAALAVSLIILLVMTVIGVAGMSTSVLQERMSGNLRDRQLAFEAAEAALRAGEVAGADFNSDLTGHFVRADGINWRTFDWGDALEYTDGIDGVAAQPRYYIEEMAFDSDFDGRTVRVTARGVGRNAATVVVLQSTFIY